MLYPDEKESRFRRAQTIDSACREIEKSIVCANNYSSSLSALSTKYVHLDRVLGGIKPGDFVLVTTSSLEAGKDFIASIASRIAYQGVPVEYFVCDTDLQSIAMRVVNSWYGGLWRGTEIKEASCRHLQEAVTAVEQLSCFPIVFHQNEPSQTLELLRLTAHRLKSDIGRIRKGLIVIDHLDALDDMNDLEDSGIKKSLLVSLKKIAKKFGIPILALTGVESSETKSADSSLRFDDSSKYAEQFEADLMMSIRFEPIRDFDVELGTSFAGISVLRTNSDSVEKVTLVYDSKHNKYIDYFEVHDQELADSNLPKKLFIETNPIEINHFIQHAEETKTLVLDSLGDIKNARIRAQMYINCWIEDGIPQQLAKSIEKGCRELHIDRIKIG